MVATVFEVEGDAPARVGDRIVFDQAGEVPSGGGAQELAGAVQGEARSCLERRQSTIKSISLASGRVDALLEYIAPAVRLLLFGAGLDAVPVVRMAAELGWQVTVLDNRPAYLRPGSLPDSAEARLVDFEKLDASELDIDASTPAVVMTHHFLHDVGILKLLLASDAPYVGVLGPRQRTENLLAELHDRGFRPDENQLSRLHGPVGIDIGSETPEEIALSMLAEIQAVLNGRTAGFLRLRRDPLHDWTG